VYRCVINTENIYFNSPFDFFFLEFNYKPQSVVLRRLYVVVVFDAAAAVYIPAEPNFVCFWRDSPPVGQSLLIHEVSRSHNDAPQSVGLLWTSDQPVAETST